MKLAMHFLLMAVVVLGLCVGGCKPMDTKPKPDDVRPPQKTKAMEEAEQAKRPADIGDAESELKVSLVVAEPAPANVKSEELRNTKNDLDMVTITVSPPAAPQLNMELIIGLAKDLKGSPVAMRVKILRDKDVIATQNVVVGPKANRQAFQYAFDALAGLQAPPQSMLLHAEAEIILLPQGTDPATVDAATVTGTPDSTGTILSNPARVEFAAQAPSA